MSYANQKLVDAVRLLATSNDPLGIRLADAYCYFLIHLRPENFGDDESRKKFEKLSAFFSSREPAHRLDGQARASVRRRKSSTLESYSKLIFELFEAEQGRSGKNLYS